MKKLLIAALTLVGFNAFAQYDKQTGPIVEEGKKLYRSEMASWFGTDLFLEKYKDRDNIGGYFSYSENDIAKCIFFSKAEDPKVIGTITFDSTYNINSAIIDLTERVFTDNEKDLFVIRQDALNRIRTDTLYKLYKKTSFNLIPLINGKEKKVYVLTGPQEDGVVIFGNDYLLTYNANNKLLDAKQLHNNIMILNYGKGDVVQEIGMHTHLAETGDFITATDICTLMLYEKYTTWKSYYVMSEKYISIWDCKKDSLFVMTRAAFDKINKDQEKRHPKK